MNIKRKLTLTIFFIVVAPMGLLSARALAKDLGKDLAIYPYKVGELVYAPRVEANQEAVENGKKVYAMNCARCHGLKGDGKGPLAFVLEPKPRNFKNGTFKLRSTESGQLPTDEDLFRTIAAGIPGSGMPAWKEQLSVQEIWQSVHYIKGFYPFWKQDLKLDPLKTIPIVEAPEFDQDTVAKGKALYTKVKCGQCHGDTGVGDGPSAGTLKDEWGKKILPGDMTKPWFFRSGSKPNDIHRAFNTGLNGTPMPSFKGDLSDTEQWHLVSYILSLAKGRPVPQLIESQKGPEISPGLRRASEIGSRVGKPDVVFNLVQGGWKTWPKEIRVKKGQVVEIRIWTTDNGVGAGHGFAIDGYEDRVFVNGITMESPKAIRFVANRPGEFDFYCSTQCDTGQLSVTMKTMGIWGHPFMGGSFIVE